MLFPRSLIWQPDAATQDMLTGNPAIGLTILTMNIKAPFPLKGKGPNDDDDDSNYEIYKS